MKTYVGTKILEAKAMSRVDYNKLRGWEVPADENPADAGYLVEYIDGGQANHPDHKGYISWSPKDVFEGSYTPVDNTKGLEPWQLGVVAELAQNEERLAKLTAALDGDKIPLSGRGLLMRQRVAMLELSEVLRTRSQLFTKENRNGN